MEEYLPYLPVVIAILAASLGYISGQRSGKINRFLLQVDTNLKEVCGPLNFTLQHISETNDPALREGLIDDFFREFNSLNPTLYKLGNKFIIRWHFKCEKLYQTFKISRDVKDWEEFWRQLESLRIMVDEEYWKNFDSLYGEYRWFQSTLTSNIFIKICKEVLHFLFQAIHFTTLASLIFVFYSIWDYFLIKYFPSGTILLSVLVLTLSIMIYGFLMIIGASIAGLRNQRESLIKKVLEKRSPKIIDFWEDRVLRSSKKEIPEMYKQRNIEL
ncbi:hypothetical protein FZC79_22045 [Rossellomorea vietnamensis]|uniref:Uncharacterized protein n=1 Tax=Rossellomorea vietnamensis TaxID=218284 RepID=A0A5D4K7P1_9BACI|nr:hypothetical protein FZC79_22045 [Rossellomorea vietnamensis]